MIKGLAGVLFVLVIAFGIWLTYRYATRDHRLAPKRQLQRQIKQLRTELNLADELHEDLVSLAAASRQFEPLLADQVIIQITEHKKARAALRGELSA